MDRHVILYASTEDERLRLTQVFVASLELIQAGEEETETGTDIGGRGCGADQNAKADVRRPPHVNTNSDCTDAHAEDFRRETAEIHVPTDNRPVVGGGVLPTEPAFLDSQSHGLDQLELVIRFKYLPQNLMGYNLNFSRLHYLGTF